MAIDLENRTPKSAVIDSSSANIPTAFAFGDAGSLALTGITYARHIAIINYTTSELAFAYSTGSSAGNPTQTDGYCPAAAASSFAAVVLDDVYPKSACLFIRSDSGSAISSGKVKVFVW